eukprot:TRINITY_DN47966_c0_g1_i1.p1 TRINITY_DN47966_c0_g1~~TRINITY_DN47966_c0_g1_i1.p1  ORF type:complete len:361 (-),score=161.10 TRINITY_DN47966_c0_g1_i1:221-1303(-)
MAKAMKRSAPAAKDAGAKKQKVAKMSKVAKVVKGAETYPQAVRAMLVENLELTLGLAKEERHQFQERIVQMLGEVLTSVQTGLEGKVAEAEGKVAAAEVEKGNREAAATAATATVTEKNEAVAQASTALSDATASVKQATKALKDAQAEQKQGDKDLESAEKKKNQLSDAFANSFTPLKNGEAEGVSGRVSTLAKISQEFGFDAALSTSLPSALGKAAAERGSFDNLVIGQVEAELQKHIESLTVQLAEGEPGKQERAAKVAAAEATLTACKATEEAAQGTQAASQAALKEAEADSKAKAKLLKQAAPELKQANAELSSLKEELKDLMEGAVAEFKESAERSNKVPDPEPVAPEEATSAA